MAKPENQIDYVELPASDIGRTKEFYNSAFGWKFEDYGPDYTSFSDGRLAGGFTRDRQGRVRDLLLVIYAEDLVAAESRVKAAGGIISKEIFSFPGGRRFHFLDPNGNELAVWSEQD